MKERADKILFNFLNFYNANNVQDYPKMLEIMTKLIQLVTPNNARGAVNPSFIDTAACDPSYIACMIRGYKHVTWLDEPPSPCFARLLKEFGLYHKTQSYRNTVVYTNKGRKMAHIILDYIATNPSQRDKNMTYILGTCLGYLSGDVEYFVGKETHEFWEKLRNNSLIVDY